MGNHNFVKHTIPNTKLKRDTYQVKIHFIKLKHARSHCILMINKCVKFHCCIIYYKFQKTF